MKGSVQWTSEQRRKIEQPALPGALTLRGHVGPGAIDQRTEPRIVAHSGEHGIDDGDPIVSPARIVGALKLGECAVGVADQRTRGGGFHERRGRTVARRDPRAHPRVTLLDQSSRARVAPSLQQKRVAQPA